MRIWLTNIKPAIAVQSLRCQLIESYIMFHVCSALSLITTLYYLSLLSEDECDS